MLEVAAVSGERAVVGVTVPALPPPPPPAPPPPPPPAVPREIFTGPPGGGAYYITIDDGWFPNNDVLALMQQQHIPITTFLLSDAAAAHLDFWKSFLAAGGEIEDHTINHPDLTKLSAAAAQAQWQGGADRLHALLGVSPVLGRPPYGAANAAVVGAAGHAGLHGVVMWSATMNGGHLATNDGKPLHAGSIVLMHWTSDVWLNLQTVLAMGNAAGLHPALLGPALQQTGY
jgi:peptidoglycan/xylan/chitin deacetylase (PgdA/CDA1 family)